MSTIARFTTVEYDRLIETGVFDFPVKRRVELLHGEIRVMNPAGPFHENVVDICMEWSFEVTRNQGIRIRVQNSVGLPELDSVPEPDIAWVRKKSYRASRPRPRDVLLVIEVSHSSLVDDLGEKAELYAAVGIADYWVVNVEEECVHVFRKPGKSGYRDQSRFSGRQSVSPLALPKAKLTVGKLFE